MTQNKALEEIVEQIEHYKHMFEHAKSIDPKQVYKIKCAIGGTTTSYEVIALPKSFHKESIQMSVLASTFIGAEERYQHNATRYTRKGASRVISNYEPSENFSYAYLKMEYFIPMREDELPLYMSAYTTKLFKEVLTGKKKVRWAK